MNTHFCNFLVFGVKQSAVRIYLLNLFKYCTCKKNFQSPLVNLKLSGIIPGTFFPQKASTTPALNVQDPLPVNHTKRNLLSLKHLRKSPNVYLAGNGKYLTLKGKNSRQKYSKVFSDWWFTLSVNDLKSRGTFY